MVKAGLGGTRSVPSRSRRGSLGTQGKSVRGQQGSQRRVGIGGVKHGSRGWVTIGEARRGAAVLASWGRASPGLVALGPARQSSHVEVRSLLSRSGEAVPAW